MSALDLTVDFITRLKLVDYRSVTAQSVENLPSASRKPSEEKEQIILCHVCVKKNEKLKKKADMYCYVCNNVFCDHHSGVSDDTIDISQFPSSRYL